MRRTSRLFELIQLLRQARKPMTAATLAAVLEVTSRTVYRDVATLQGMAVPIVGKAGIGYVMRGGYDLPPLTLTIEEVEALVVAVGLLGRTGDRGLKAAATALQGKISAVLPRAVREPIDDMNLFVSTSGVDEVQCIDLRALRGAIRDERILAFDYRDGRDVRTERVIRPIGIIYYVEVVVLVGWCELRRELRHFRLDRMSNCVVRPETFIGQGAKLRERWQALEREARRSEVPRQEHRDSSEAACQAPG